MNLECFFLVFISSSVKFLFAIPLAVLQCNCSFFNTLIVSFLGGSSGVLFFSKFSSFILEKYNSWKSRSRFFKKSKKRKKRSLKTIITIKIMRRYGLYGIAFLTPVLLSIPIGTFLALRFYPNTSRTIPLLVLSVFFWSVLLTLIFIQF